MEFKTLHIENFGSIGNVQLKLDTPGLVLVQGKNKDASLADSNGAGKSLLFDALCWCLWGNLPRGLEDADDVVNLWTGQKDCRVTLTLVDEGHTYVIYRCRKDTRAVKPNDLVLTVDGGQPIGESIKATQAKVDALVGFDFWTFCAMMPGTGVEISKMTDKEIKTLLESLLHTSQIADAHDKVKEQRKNLQFKLDSTILDIAKLMSDLDTNKASILRLIELKNSIEEREQVHKDTIRDLLARMVHYETELAKLPEFEEQINILTAEKKTIEASLEYFSSSYQSDINSNNNHFYRLESQISHKNGAISMYKQKMASTGTCPNCFQQIDKAAITKHLDKEFQLLVSEKKAMEAERDLIAEDIRVYKNVCKDQFDDYEHQLASKEFAINSLKEIYQDLRKYKPLLLETKVHHDQEQKALLKIKQETMNIDDVITNNRLVIESLVNKYAILTKDTKILRREIKICDFWLDGFSQTGLRSFMLDYVTPILNEKAEYYSKVLTNGELEVIFSTKSKLKDGTIKEKFTISVVWKNGGNKFSMNSKGERARANLVIAMALGDLATYRTSKQLPWRFLDEPFEGVDATGTDAIIRLLQDQKARYKTVFVVTHKESFKQMFSKTITIVKEKKISFLEGEDDSKETS